MPVRSLHSPIFTWPDATTVRRAATAWARELAARRPEVLRVGLFGSYARDDAGVGSDLDLIVVVDRLDLPFARRGLLYDTLSLPVSADVLVYTAEEFQRLLEGGGRFARVLAGETVWLAGPPGATTP